MRGVEAIMQSQLASDVDQHVVLIYPNQGRKDLTIGSERGVKGRLYYAVVMYYIQLTC